MSFTSLKIGDLVSRIPIIQGGMGVGISMSGLASAVANEGGIGIIATAMIGIDEPDVSANPLVANVRALKREIRKARSMTKGIIGVNIMVALTHYADLVKASIEEAVDIIISGAGLPLDLPGFLVEGAKTKLVPIVSSARAAKILSQKWLSKYNRLPDAFVVEGPKAGGHLGFKKEQINDPDYALEKLVKEVIETVGPIAAKCNTTIPVIAAGGIYTGGDIRKMLDLGAAGVQMGTRFVATFECDAALDFKKAYVDAKQEDLMIINSPVGMPGRALHNKFLDDVENGIKKPFKCPYHCIKTCDVENSPYCIALALAGAKKGKFKSGFAFAGSNAYRVNEIVSVKDLIQTLQLEFSQAQS
ncbi:MAG: nitronate monooxygenase [Desulfobacterium sp.]|nr:nitronate monooxygenase [Desulfobacterium sp.]MBU3949442.1 nitronate monooxygenase [Pseudomonadota bacterium]MBU4010041.1 nitronate monooxygenase [Pseudomonadota bacterium]MBU4035933.1 nitronate monooxygenase [Pseudomonadota bacterium]